MYRWMSIAAIVVLTLDAVGAGAADLGADPAQPEGGVVGDGTPGSCDEGALAAALAGGGVVSFNCGGPKTITLTEAQTITQTTTIFGSDSITLTGSGTNRLFVVAAGANLRLQHLVLTNGHTNGGQGGAIHNSGALYLEGVTLQDSHGNMSDYGGAIVTFGPLHIQDSTLRNNTAGFGGAVYADNFYHTASVVVTNSTFSGNKALNSSGTGGAILLGEGAQLAYTDGQLIGNSALLGGAVYASAGTVVTLTGQAGLSLIGNAAQWDGGALYNVDGQMRLSNVELFGNTTPTGTVAIGYGGAIFSGGLLFISDSYLAHNEGRFGGAVCACAAGPSSGVFVFDSTFALNTAGSFGGGLYSNTGVIVAVTGSSFNGNTAGTGGGLARINSSLAVWRSSFTFNTAQAGGGLFAATAPLTDHTIGGYVDVRDVTFSGNTASGTLGGGVYNTGLLQLYSVTLKDNSSGMFTESGGEIRLRSSVLQNTGANCQGPTPVDDGANYATDLTCSFALSTQGNGLDPKLGPLTSDGLLTTYFHLPAADSPLVNHGPASASQCSDFDQRGRERVDRCDIGAVEYRAMVPEIWLPVVLR